MTPTNKAWIDKRTRWCNSQARILEIGSRDINGAPARRTPYHFGLDLIIGKGVDVRADGHALPFADNYFDFTICAETLEHDAEPWTTAREIYRVAKSGGLVIVTVPGIGFPRHDFPSDYWRFTTDGLALLFKDFEILECVPDAVEKAVRLAAKKC
jgi:SAM-dependent methyltransferase